MNIYDYYITQGKREKMDNKERVLRKIVETYFGNPEKTVEEILLENIEDLPIEYKNKFLINRSKNHEQKIP